MEAWLWLRRLWPKVRDVVAASQLQRNEMIHFIGPAWGGIGDPVLGLATCRFISVVTARRPLVLVLQTISIEIPMTAPGVH
jgi:hypothetical protein